MMDAIMNRGALQLQALPVKGMQGSNELPLLPAVSEDSSQEAFSVELLKASSEGSPKKAALEKVAGEEIASEVALGAQIGMIPHPLLNPKEVKATPQVEGATTPKQMLRESPGNLGPAGMLMPLQAERVAHGMNTVSAIAGPKPWSKDWVFEGVGKTPNLETLLPAKEENPLLGMLMARLQMEEAGQATPTAARSLNGKGSDPKTTGATAQGLGGPEAGLSLEMLAALGGELESVRGEMGDDEPSASAGQLGVKMPAKRIPPRMMGGDEFLSAWQDVSPQAVQGKSAVAQALNEGLSAGGASQVLSGPAKGRFVPAGEDFIPRTAGTRAESLAGLPNDAAAQAAATAAHRSPMTAGQGAIKPRPMEVLGHVTQGAMTRSRLTSESLLGITSNVRTIAGDGSVPANGEMKIRLRPDNLGELFLRVNTRGHEVGLQIRASDPGAKKIIEESLNHLRDSFASNNLSLARVEVLLDSGASAGNSQQNFQQGQQNHSQQSQQDLSNWNAQSGGFQFGQSGQSGFGRDGQATREYGEEVTGSSGLNRPRLGGLGPVMNLRSAQGSAGAGRVDVTV